MLLSTSHDQDTERIGCESEGTWFYGTTVIFLLGNCADSYDSAICGFWNGRIVLNFDVISRFSECELLRKRKILFKIGWTDTFEIGEKWVRICYP